MSNILKVTQPMVGYDNANNLRTNPSSQGVDVGNIKAPVVPNKVMRPDGRNDAGRQNDAALRFNYESNFNSFIKRLNGSPESVKEFMKLLQEQIFTLAKSGISAGTAEEISRFFAMIGLSEATMGAFIKDQADQANRFRGPLFDLLRQVMKNTDSVDLKAAILEFVKKYGSMASGSHIMENIRNDLIQCPEYMYPKQGEELKQLISQLRYGSEHVNGDTADNAELLKNKILPFLNRYIGAVHDRGNLRNLATRIAYNMARYENGDMKGLLELFDRLKSYPGFNKAFDGMDTEVMRNILNKASQQSEENGWAKEFVNLFKAGLAPEAGRETKAVFQNLMNSILLNESVYMPVMHLMLPMDIDGRLLYSEMWVDPDAGGEEGSSSEESRMVKALIKFDIEQVGFFDLFFICQNGEVTMQLDYPEHLLDKDREIRTQIDRIMAENGLRLKEFVTGSSREPITISEAFPQIYERKNTVNVRV